MAEVSEEFLELLMGQLSDINKNMATRADVDRIEQRLCFLDEKVFKGNGSKPLVMLVAELQESVRQLWKAYYSFKRSCSATHGAITQVRADWKTFFRDKLAAPLITGITVGVTVGLIVKIFVK
jgi:hypothetical protein